MAMVRSPPPPAAAMGGAEISPESEFSLRPRKFRPERGQQPSTTSISRAYYSAQPPDAPAPSAAAVASSCSPAATAAAATASSSAAASSAAAASAFAAATAPASPVSRRSRGEIQRFHTKPRIIQVVDLASPTLTNIEAICNRSMVTFESRLTISSHISPGTYDVAKRGTL